MKLAEALQIRADLQKRLHQLATRLDNNATVQEGSLPAENPEDLMDELDSTIEQLQDIMQRINLTNSEVRDADGQSLTELIARRDCLQKKTSMLRDFMDEASSLTSRRTLSEIRTISTVDVGRLRKKIDRLAKELRETDLKIQQMNWTVDLT